MDLTNRASLGANTPGEILLQHARTTLVETAHALTRDLAAPHYLRTSAGLRMNMDTMATLDRDALRVNGYTPWSGARGSHGNVAGVGDPAADRVLSKLLRRRRCVLFDFDGPICSTFAGFPDYEVAEALRRSLYVRFPPEVMAAKDPFTVFRYAAEMRKDDNLLARNAERRLTELECRAVLNARPTPGSAGLIRTISDRSGTIGMVSNNSGAAVNRYLINHGLRDRVDGIYSRGTDENMAHLTRLLKPDPFSLQRAMKGLGVEPRHCIYVGDSYTDIQAAHNAGIPVIAFADKPGKIEQFAPHYPDVIVHDIRTIERAYSLAA